MYKVSVLTPSIRPAGLEITKSCLESQTFQDFEWLTEIGHGRHDLNAAYNRMLARAKGEIVVSLQDYIKVMPDYLEKIVAAHEAHPKTFFTYPIGKIDSLDFRGEVRWDWRAARMNDVDLIRDAKWDCWEIDSGSAPLEALKAIGGFDEAMDGRWSCDNVNVGCRARLAGYSFKCLFDNPGIAYDHDKFIPHPFREDFDPSFNTKRMAMFEGGMTLAPIP